MESQSLTDAAEALDQGRNEDAIAFLREAVRDAEPNGDEETLVAVVGLARRIPGPEAQELVDRLSEATVPPRRSAAQLTGLVIFLVLAAVFAATQLTERVLGPATPGESDLAQVPDLSPARTLSGTKVYLVPMGRLDAVDPQRLSQHLEDTYRIETEILPVLALPGIAFDPDRDQLKADTLLVTLARRYPVAGSQTVVIGLTDFDTFRSLDPSLRYVFSTRARSGYAVVSAARMGPGLLERVLRRDSTEERMRKMVERNVGLLFYHLQLRPDPSSLLRDEIMSVDDIDEMQGGLSFAPYPPS